MSQIPGSPSPTDDLQFQTVEPAASAAAPSAMSCIACKRPLTDTYFAIGDKIVCESCCTQIQARYGQSSPAHFAMAAIYGLGAAIVGAIGWYIIVEMSHWEIGLVAIAIGYIVARAIRKGSGGRGGTQYQILAVVLTYLSIVAYDGAKFVEYARMQVPNLVFNGELAMQAASWAVTAPFKGDGAHVIMGLVIIGFALYQAWRMTGYRLPPISGPFKVGPRAPIAASTEVQA